MDVVGGFAMMCRCGKTQCVTHTKSDDPSRAVLPAVAEPVSYDLSLALRLEDHAFDGTVSIVVDVKKAGLAELSLNAKELTFASASFAGVGAATTIEPHATRSDVKLVFASPLPVGQGTLSIVFSGVLNSDMAGFYRSSYTDIAGESKLMASTQFESIDARRCFPCWDEPLRKATFACALRVPRHMAALSNMPESMSRDHGDGTKTVSFLPSPRMSTYLLAFVVGEFDHVSALTKNGVMIRCFCPPGKPQLGEFALRCAVAALDNYDETFECPYPLPKSDMVAIPEFAAGAMENWGLVTYREVDLLLDEATASSRQKQRVAEVVIHELAHQWFGNLVTMECVRRARSRARARPRAWSACARGARA